MSFFYQASSLFETLLAQQRTALQPKLMAELKVFKVVCQKNFKDLRHIFRDRGRPYALRLVISFVTSVISSLELFYFAANEV